jgi:NAD(P)-dependent dehydrogenase (short-subunit alcohol dehydrogenase family)
MTTPQLPTIPEPTAFGDLLSLKGKCAIVTGGTKGLGEATVHRLAQAGASVVFTARGAEALKQVELDVTAAGGTAVGVAADVSSLEDSQRVVDLAVERFGAVDILVNNAALYTMSFAMDTSEELFDSIVAANLKGAFFLAQYAAKAMIAAGRGGRIINILSNDAFKPMGPLAAYAASKLGLWAATENMAKELAPHRILVNAVTPGSTITQERLDMFTGGSLLKDNYGASEETLKKMQAALPDPSQFAAMLTTMMPLGRPGWPDEIANAVLYMASDLGSYTSGANLVIDGAQHLR